MANISEILAVAGLLPAAVGLGSSVVAARRHRRAERDLVTQLRKGEELRNQLANLRTSLAEATPSQDKVAEAEKIVVSAADALDQKKKNEIMKTLDRVSTKNRANFIMMLTDESTAQRSDKGTEEKGAEEKGTEDKGTESP